MTRDELIEDAREALGVSSSWDAKIKRKLDDSVRYFLRNWNFPRAGEIVKRNSLNSGTKEILMTSPSKRIMLVQLQDNRSPGQTFYKNFQRSSGFRLPHARDQGVPGWWWTIGDRIIFEQGLPESGLDIWVYRQHLDPSLGLEFMLEEIPDALLIHLVYTNAPGWRKTEAAQAYAPLWAEQVKSLAIYANELEFEGVFLEMGAPGSRTPQSNGEYLNQRYGK